MGLLSLTLLSSCGDLSNFDLLFHAQAPRRDIAVFDPPGLSIDDALTDFDDEDNDSLSVLSADLADDTTTQALRILCGPRDLRCRAVRLSLVLNRIAIHIFNGTEKLSAQTPTLRQLNRRVYGPVYAAGVDLSFRLELIRQVSPNDSSGEANPDGRSLDFCLHILEGQASNDEIQRSQSITCDTLPADSAWQRLAVGSIDLGDPQIKSGVASIDLATLGLFPRFPVRRGILDVVYTHTNTNTHLDMQLNTDDIDASDPNSNLANSTDEEDNRLLPKLGAYQFDKNSDGSGSFTLEMQDQFIGLPRSPVDDLRVSLQWLGEADGFAGRADAVIVDGNNPERIVNASECWDADLTTVFYTDTAAAHPDFGNAASCVLE